MLIVFIGGFGIFALMVIAIQTWRERKAEQRRLADEWNTLLTRMLTAQAMGHHRIVREQVLQSCRGLDQGLVPASQVPQLKARLASLLVQDPVYPAVLQEIRSACSAQLEVSEFSLAVSLREFLIEDIRQCLVLAEAFGQVERRDEPGDTRVAANFHHAAL
ncbi:hypothetical protein [Zoogloea sp.]|uniref:hypothetical protein n=1 Tax=Zoogloea sp. TaxID=49181 RepID=UPI0035B20F77